MERLGGKVEKIVGDIGERGATDGELREEAEVEELESGREGIRESGREGMGEMEGNETPRFCFGRSCLGEDEGDDVDGEFFGAYEKEVSTKRT